MDKIKPGPKPKDENERYQRVHITLPPEMYQYIVDRAKKFHSGNISEAISTIIRGYWLEDWTL